MTSNIHIPKFSDRNDFIKRTEHFKKGSIVPTRLFRMTKIAKSRKGKAHKQRHLLKFQSDVHLINFLESQILIILDKDYSSMMHIHYKLRNVHLELNPYGSGSSYFLAIRHWDEFDSQLRRICEEIIEKQKHEK